MNKIKKHLQVAVRQVKISRFRAYKRLGFLGNRKIIDRLVKIIFVFFLFATTIALFYPISEQTSHPLTDALETTEKTGSTSGEEIVHAEFSDEPVVPDQGTSLIELEKGVKLSTVMLSKYTVQKNETLSTILGKAKIPAAERSKIIEALSLLIDLKTIKSKTTVFVFKDKSATFLGLSIPLSDENIVAVLKEEGGVYTPFSHEGRVETKSINIAGSIERTFSGSVQKSGLPKALVSRITNALDGEIDFSTFRPNDAFDIVYEKKMTPGGLELDTQVLYIGLTIGKKQYHRYAWTDKSGAPGFYNPKGEVAAKTLLKRPVKARARLSSSFGNRRHPVLMYNVFHSGVDLAAPLNTPIVAAGDGVITQLGRKGAYGKYIRIKHSSSYQTAYGHMNGYKSSLKVGSKVKRGDVIGYIGSTGRSTGPHLHFEVIKGGKITNPFDNHMLIAKKLTGFELEQFQSYAESVHSNFQKHLIGNLAPIPPKKPNFIATKSNAKTKK